MKKSFFILAVCSTIISSASAQVSFGAKAGGAITSLPGDFTNYNKKGLYGGFTAEIPVGKRFSAAAELVYSMQGNKQRVLFADFYPFEPDNGDVEEKVTMQLNYINLPVLIKYQFTKRLFVETGLQAGLLASAKVKTSKGTGDTKDNYESFDLSWPVGAGYQLQNGFGVNLRYNAGLTNVYKGNLREPHNSVFQAGLFYKWKKD